MVNDLFDQATAQLNFLLLSQRNMILVSAFGLALAQFKKKLEYPFLKYLVISLFIYAIAVGSKSIQDFNYYIKDTRDTGSLHDKEVGLLNRYETWVYFSYTLIGIIIFILLTFTQIEFFNKFHNIIGLHNKKKIN
jgi:hypothetical protein